MLNVLELRQKVVTEALEWVGTPYHHAAGAKGPKGGVDCGILLFEVFKRAAVIQDFKIDNYSREWHLHRSEEIYLKYVEKVAKKISTTPLPGDIIVFRYGRTFSHGAIVIKYPEIVHAFLDVGFVTLDNVEVNQDLAKREKMFYSLWG